MGLQVMRSFGKNGLRRVNRRAERGECNTAPVVPLVGRPEGADERSRIGEIINSRSLHAWKDRWAHAAANRPPASWQKSSSSPRAWIRFGRPGAGIRKESALGGEP